MKYVIFAAALASSLYILPTCAMDQGLEPSDQAFTRRVPQRQETPEEMLRRFKEQTSPTTLKQLQQQAHKILEQDERRKEQRAASVARRVAAH